MKFMFIHLLDETRIPHALEWDPDKAGIPAWVEEMGVRGHLLDGERLRPSTDATVVRRQDGRTEVLDGPFAETKEQIAGYDAIEAADMDEALAIAAAHPTVHNGGAIEVRAFGPDMPTPTVPEATPGRRRYLHMVVSDAAQYERFFTEFVADREAGDTVDGAGEPAGIAAEVESDIDAWLNKHGGARIYGWELTPPSTASTVRLQDGKPTVLDGPYAETKEHIVGYDLIECEDLDQAIAIAADHPAGAVELRPVWQ